MVGDSGESDLFTAMRSLAVGHVKEGQLVAQGGDGGNDTAVEPATDQGDGMGLVTHAANVRKATA